MWLDDQVKQIGILVSSGTPVESHYSSKGHHSSQGSLKLQVRKMGEGKQLLWPQVKSWRLAQASSVQGWSLRCRETLMNLSLASLKGSSSTPPPSNTVAVLFSEAHCVWMYRGLARPWLVECGHANKVKKNQTYQERTVKPGLRGGERTLDRPRVAKSSQSEWQGNQHWLRSSHLFWLSALCTSFSLMVWTWWLPESCMLGRGLLPLSVFTNHQGFMI